MPNKRGQHYRPPGPIPSFESLVDAGVALPYHSELAAEHLRSSWRSACIFACAIFAVACTVCRDRRLRYRRPAHSLQPCSAALFAAWLPNPFLCRRDLLRYAQPARRNKGAYQRRVWVVGKSNAVKFRQSIIIIRTFITSVLVYLGFLAQ